MKNPTPLKIETPGAEEADGLVITILTWLSSEPGLMNRFLSMSGIEASAIRQLVDDPGFKGGLTGFLMNHEPTLLAFCQQNDVKVEFVQACHRHFTGAAEGVWL